MKSAHGRTILIVGLDYWPDVTGIAPYTTQFAEFLAELGEQVHVLAGMPYYPEWKIKHGYDRRGRLKENRNGVTVHRRRQYIPHRQSALRRAMYEGSFLVQCQIPLDMPKPDLVIGVVPALSDGLAAAQIAKRHNVPLSLWIQDLMGQAAKQSGLSGGKRIARQTASVEGWIARRAQSIAIIAEGFRPHLQGMGVRQERIHRVHNWSHTSQPTMTQRDARIALDLPLNRTICLHAGNMGLKQGLDRVVEAARIALTEVPHLYFVLMGDGSQRPMLEVLGAGLPNLRFLNPVDNVMFPNALHAADVLLLHQREDVTDMSLPSKLSAYKSSHRLILATASPSSELGRELVSVPGSRVVNPGSPRTLANELSLISADLQNDPTGLFCRNSESKAAGLASLYESLIVKSV